MGETIGVGQSVPDVNGVAVEVAKKVRKPRVPKVYDIANAELGSKLRLARRMAGMSLRDVGQRLGVSAASIHSYESGRIAPKVHVLRSICEVIGVNAASILQSGVEVKVDADAVTRDIIDLLRSAPPQVRVSIRAMLMTMTEQRAA